MPLMILLQAVRVVMVVPVCLCACDGNIGGVCVPGLAMLPVSVNMLLLPGVLALRRSPFLLRSRLCIPCSAWRLPDRLLDAIS